MYDSSLCFLMQQLKGESLLTAHSKMNLNVFHWPRRSRNSSRRSTITQSRQALGLLSLYVTDGSLFIGRHTDIKGKYDCLGENYTPPSTTHEYLQARFTKLATPEKDETEASWIPTLYRRLGDTSKCISRGLNFSRPGMNVLLHRDFAPPGNIIVRHVAIDLSDKKEWELSGIIEAPVEVAYNCPGWVWATLMKVLLEAALTRKIGILMHPCSTTIVARLRKRLLRRLRGYYQGSWKWCAR